MFSFTVTRNEILYGLNQQDKFMLAVVIVEGEQYEGCLLYTSDGKRKGTVGFALTALQRRLASSPAAIYESLKRRRQKLTRRVEEEKIRQRGQSLACLLYTSRCV